MFLAAILTMALATDGPACVTERDAPIPRVTAEQNTAAFWLDRLSRSARESVLVESAELPRLNASLLEARARPSDVLVVPATDLAERRGDALDRLERYASEVRSGLLVTPSGDAIGDARARIEKMVQVDELRAVHAEADMRCLPTTAPIFKVPVDPAFDRNQCSGLHFGEIVRILARARGGWLFVSAGHSTGWVAEERLSRPLRTEEARVFLREGRRAVVIRDSGPWRIGVSYPVYLEPGGVLELLVPTRDGFENRTVDLTPFRVGTPPLTRNSLFDIVFSLAGTPYGWGDTAGYRDCSRLVLDAFAAFGIQLGRNSAMQSRAGSWTVDLTASDDAAKRAQITRAGRQGVVLLYMPGHIMLYVGEYEGQPYAISAISEFAEPCPVAFGQPLAERVLRTDRVAVTDLELGRGTTRTSFLERITRLVVFGTRP